MYGFIPNLHVTLLGDEFRSGKYLPYGKQLVRQLMASGRYADKRSVSPANGILVETRISGDHRWIRITAEECHSIFMDSGLAGLHNLGLQNPELTGQDGTLHYNSTIRAYLSGNKLLGSIVPPLLSCVPSVELNATKAFAAEVKDAIRDPESETVLAVKKYTTANIPSSLFTGKLRLYVQSQYGRELTAWRFEANSSNLPPSLDLSATTAANEQVTFQFHSSHSGILTDEFKQHWLVQLGVKGAYASPDRVNLFKMTVPPCVEKMRELLLSDTLSSAEKERIEAYLLSQSTPDWDSCISLACPIPVTWNLGYGWHFNWDGDKTDIISINAIDLGGAQYKYVSTHYRISITRNSAYINDSTNSEFQNEARRWSATLAVVEVSEWKNPKWQNVIAFPDWGVDQLEVFGQLLGTKFGSSAPVYCFYNRNVLQVARFSYSGGIVGVSGEATSDPSYFMGESVTPDAPGAWPCGSYRTLGSEGASAQIKTRNSSIITTSFSCAGAIVGSSEDAYSYTRITQSGKSQTDMAIVDLGYFIASGDTMTVPTGSPMYSLDGVHGCFSQYEPTFADAWSHVSVGGYARWEYAGATYSYTQQTVSGSHSEGVNTLMVVPFGDAEALYLWGNKFISEADSGNTNTYLDTNWFGGYTSGIRVNGSLMLHDDFASPSNLVDSTGASNNSIQYENLGSYCVAGSGVQVNVLEIAVSDFFVGEPATHVPQRFWTVTSAGLDADTYGNGVNLRSGYITEGTFMGWA